MPHLSLPKGFTSTGEELSWTCGSSIFSGWGNGQENICLEVRFSSFVILQIGFVKGLPRLDRAMTWIGSGKEITDFGDRCNRFVQFSTKLRLCICICFLQQMRLAQTVGMITRIPWWVLLMSRYHHSDVGSDRYFSACLKKIMVLL